MGAAVWLLDELCRCVYLTSALYAVFNLIPLPPLDGSSILRHFYREVPKTYSILSVLGIYNLDCAILESGTQGNTFLSAAWAVDGILVNS